MRKLSLDELPKVSKWQGQAFNLDLSGSKNLCSFPYTSLFLSVKREWWFLEREEKDPRPDNPQAMKIGTFS